MDASTAYSRFRLPRVVGEETVRLLDQGAPGIKIVCGGKFSRMAKVENTQLSGLSYENLVPDQDSSLYLINSNILIMCLLKNVWIL